MRLCGDCRHPDELHRHHFPTFGGSTGVGHSDCTAKGCTCTWPFFWSTKGHEVTMTPLELIELDQPARTLIVTKGFAACPYCGHRTLFHPEGWVVGGPVTCANPYCDSNHPEEES